MSSNVIGDIRGNFHGRVVMPGEGEYDEARSVFNAMIDRRPAAVILVADVSDVIEGVRLARDRGLELAIRGGGHSGPGFGAIDDGIVLDFSERTRVEVDPTTRRARADAGTTWSTFNRVTHEHGLATPGGVQGTTGIAGLTLGGGIGYLSRKYGLTCDNLLSAEVVTADGSLLTASEAENADLFWALRGGGGNFGVVTSFEYQLHPVDNVHAGIIIYPLEHARTVAEFYREQIKTAPEEFGIFLGFHQGPPVPFLPVEWVGQPVCVIVGMWTGDLAEGPGMWQPYLDVAPVVGSMVGEMPYPALNGAFDELIDKGLQDYWKANFISELSDGAIDAYIRFGQTVPSLQTSVHVYPINGAVQRVAADATAFAYRHANFAPVIAGFWEDPADNEANTNWVRDLAEALRPHAEAGGYINFMDADDQGRIADNYGGNYARLAQIKAKYDPSNLFHVNQNIKPAT